MEIDLQRLATGFDPASGRCFTHARAAVAPGGEAYLTMQPLRLSGTDVFYGIHTRVSRDSGKTWSDAVPSRTLVRHGAEGDPFTHVICDAQPLYHRKTGMLMLLGQEGIYLNDDLAPAPRPRYTVWSVFDRAAGDWTPEQRLAMPERYPGEFFSCGFACGQCHELDDGQLLIPVHYMDYESAKGVTTDATGTCSSVMVLRCAFDGTTLQVLELGGALACSVPRGFAEPSIVAWGGAYFLALRNDATGYAARSADGLHYETPVPLCFDDGQNAGNYCTQQHWLTGGGRLYLVYTRRAENNGHIPRHRAPLFAAQFDPERMCLIRATERIAVPERGARLGNFGCTQAGENEAWVVAAEWMQSGGGLEACMARGSDNSVFISKFIF